MTKAIEIFNKLEKGILNIIKAGDVYATHIMANKRNQIVPKEHIDQLIKTPCVSGWTMVGEFYSDNELKLLEEEGNFMQIGQQILLATYTSFEIYMINKFNEYYEYFLSDKNDRFIKNSLRRISFRSLEELKDNYYELLGIHLPSIEFPFTGSKCNFTPKSSWEGLKLISEARNDIAHAGKSRRFKIVTMADSWNVFDFIRRWFGMFNVNFDILIYDSKETKFIKEYKQRLSLISS